ncbi:MAG: hypothetical protein NVS3B12_13200 [Acidimicrobiales bacterium]
MSTTSAELSSMAASVEELTRRLGPIADTYDGAHREDLVSEIHEVERALRGALRRLNRLASAEGA